MKRSLLLLATFSLLGQAGALTLSGKLEGNVTPETRLSGWVVKGSGQPVQELVSVPVKGGSFALALPAEAPSGQVQMPVDSRISWPGLMDFGKASAAAQAAEMKFFLYRDTNGKVTMFRPDMNMKRMNRTAERVAMPVSPETSKHLLMLDSSIPIVMPSRSTAMPWLSS